MDMEAIIIILVYAIGVVNGMFYRKYIVRDRIRVWWHNGVQGTQGLVADGSKWKAIHRGKSPKGEHFSIGI
jgi:hypothetical protein